MPNESTTDLPTLRRVLLLDGGASGAMGVMLLLGADRLERLLGLPGDLLRWAAVILIPFAGLLLWIARRARAPRRAGMTVCAANVLWVLGSVLLLASGAVQPTLLGYGFVLLQAVVVAGFAYLEYGGLRRGRAAAAGMAVEARRT